MNGKTASLAVAIALGAAVSGCEGDIIDDFGVAGYAQLQGTALRADASPYPSIFVSCGPTVPGEFAGLWDTDEQGRFDVTLVAPGPTNIPANGILICIVRAPGNAPSEVSDTISVPFTEERDARITTAITLQAE